MIFAEDVLRVAPAGQSFHRRRRLRRARRPTDRGRRSNTWAAYQCYGDPDWIFRRKAPDAESVHRAARSRTSRAWPRRTSLKLALERIIVRTKFQGADPVGAAHTICRQLEKLYGEKWGKGGAVAERFGDAFVEIGAVERGLHWYEQAVTAGDGTASMKAAEQLANVRGRLGWEIVDKAQRHLDEMPTSGG